VIKEKRPRMAPEYAEVKDEVAKTWKKHRASELAEEKAAGIEKRLQDEWSRNSSVNLAASGKDVQITPLFHRGDYLPTVGPSQQFQETAFTLTKDHPFGGPVQTSKGWAVLRLKERAPLDMEQYARQKNKIKERLVDDAKQKAFEEYVTRLRIRANLQDNMKQEKTKIPGGF